jgi:hypothetical protein
MKKNLYLSLLLLLFGFTQAQKKALIIAVGDYPDKSGWNSISSLNDVPLIKDVLLQQKFLEKDIKVIQNKQANKAGIISALRNLLDESKPNDVVVIHYSGHGQQIFDDNGDEADGLDEALVPYDALANYTTNYKGENHLRDDEIEQIINSFRNKLGKNGQLLMIFDSCHSGSATRGGKARGGVGALVPDNWKPNQTTKNDTRGSGMFETTKLSDSPASFVLISGASAQELNYEYQGFGSLSYAFSSAMSQLGSDFTYRNLFAKVTSEMNVLAPKQNPVIEGDIDYKLFKGEYIKQQPYLNVKRVAKADVIEVSAGKLQQIFVGTSVFVMPAGATEVKVDKVLAKGEVTLSGYNEAVIKLDTPLKDTNERNYWVFIDKPSFGDIAVKVYIDSTAQQPDVIGSIKSYLEKNNLGEIIQEQHLSDVTVHINKGDLELSVTNDIMEIDKAIASRGISPLDDLNQKIFQFAQGQYLKGLQIKNPEYEFSFRLLPVEYDASTKEVGKFLETKSTENQVFQVKPNLDYVLLEVTNKSKNPIYLSIVEINSQGVVAPFLPNDICTLNDQERMIPSGATIIFKRCVYNFGPPYEKIMLKGFASSTPLNFQSTVKTRGASSRGNANPLEKFLQQSYVTTRGANGNKVSERIDAFSFEMVYEIVK